MRILTVIIALVLISCWRKLPSSVSTKKVIEFNETEILEQMDLAFKGIPSKYYPRNHPEYIKYNFFLDLEHGHCQSAGSRIHLYADAKRWAVVFEKSGYQNRGTYADIELCYVGNCIDYPIDRYTEQSYISNVSRIMLIKVKEFKRIENKKGEGMETFELIDPSIKAIKVRDKRIPFDSNFLHYEKLGITIQSKGNPHNLIGFGDLIRYLYETSPNLINATDKDIRKHIPKGIPKLLTIEEFHFESLYKQENPPSQQETYQLIAKVLITRDATKWKPTQKPSNSWRNWESGNL